MPTPDFEEWMKRQEIDLEDTLDIDRYQQKFFEQYGFTTPLGTTEPSPAQKAVMATAWAEKYEQLMPYNIRPITYEYETGPRAGQRETRWVIYGRPGLWSYESMREIYDEIVGAP